MTDVINRASLTIQAKAIMEAFKATLEAPIYMSVNNAWSDIIQAHFSADPNCHSWNDFVIIKIVFYEHGRETSDDVGFFTTTKVQINWCPRSTASLVYSDVAPALAIYTKAHELMTQLVASLPTEYIERGETHTERAERLLVDKTKAYCKRIAIAHSKHLRVESARLLAAAGSEYKNGEYETYYNDKSYKVILSADSTLLIRTA
jgi:hypothetical protein